MAEELIRIAEDGKISFGNHKLAAKSKLEITDSQGDMWKVKTFNEITKLEKNGSFMYESVPGSTVADFSESDQEVSFVVSADKDAQITLGMKDDTEYEVFIEGESTGIMKTGMGGKLSLSVELEAFEQVSVKIVQV